MLCNTCLASVKDNHVYLCFRYIIKGNKNFLGEIKVKKAIINFINNARTYNTLIRNHATVVTGKKL